MIYSLSFPPPAKLLSLNDREHWGPRSRKVAAWRAAGHWAAVDAINRRKLGRGLPRSVVSVTLPVRSLKTRRDASNFVATVKPIVDGLVDAGVFADDDVAHVATVEPLFRQGGDVELSIEVLA